MSNDRKPDWQWRPATEADVGRLARFCNERDFLDNCYGILRDIETQPTDDAPFDYYAYQCEHGSTTRNWEGGDTEWFSFCEVQYYANEEPL